MIASVGHIHRLLLPVLLLAVWFNFPTSVMAADTGAQEIARVNDTSVLRQDLDREMKLIALKLARQGRPVDDAQLQRYTSDIRETLINRILLQQQAQAAGIVASDSMVKKALETFRAGFQNEKAYRQALTNMGFSEAALIEQIRGGLTIKTLLDKTVLQKISISDKRVRAFYDEHPDQFRQPEQVRASHILIQLPADADETKKAEALAAIQGLKTRIEKGENFATLAMEYSGCPSKAKGGDLGFFSREQMVAPFSEAAFALHPGQVSDVVTTRFGYHLIRLTERKAAQAMVYNEVKESIASQLRQEQEEKEIGQYLDRIKEGADIKRFPL